MHRQAFRSLDDDTAECRRVLHRDRSVKYGRRHDASMNLQSAKHMMAYSLQSKDDPVIKTVNPFPGQCSA